MNNDKNATVRKSRTTERIKAGEPIQNEIQNMINQLSDEDFIRFLIILLNSPKYRGFAEDLLRGLTEQDQTKLDEK